MSLNQDLQMCFISSGYSHDLPSFMVTNVKSYICKDQRDIGLYVSRALIQLRKHFKGYRISEIHNAQEINYFSMILEILLPQD